VDELQLLGGGLELVGLALAAVGFRQTWTAHAGDEQFWAPAREWAMRRKAPFICWLRRVLRRPRHTTVGAGAATAAGAALDARAKIGWGPLPDPISDLATFAAVVHERLNRLHSTVQDLEHALKEERKTRERADEEVRTDLSAKIDEVANLSRDVAVGGIRLQLAGWFFLLVGLVVSMAANV
jgi:hypothetical protein